MDASGDLINLSAIVSSKRKGVCVRLMEFVREGCVIK